MAKKSKKTSNGDVTRPDGLRERRDKLGRRYFIDPQGRRATPGKPLKPPQPRDQWGRTKTAREKVKRTDPKTGRKRWVFADTNEKTTPPTRLPPWRDERGHFGAHPIKQAAIALREKSITYEQWRGLMRDSAWSQRRRAGVLDAAGVDRRELPASVGREHGGDGDYGSLDFGDEDDDQGGDFDGDSEHEDVFGLDAWDAMLDDLDLDERDFWEIYEETAG
jgi:hypothetical protein